jgi:UDP-4-amino-4,6-dideoxy-N-acetyl-beta-L-altrosamine N-acetyltransferase
MFEYADVCIRPIEESDLPKMVALRSDPSVWMNLGTIRMIGLKEQKQWFENLGLDNRYYYILFSKKISFIGIVRMDEIDYINRSIRVGGDILAQYRNKGYGSKMYKLILKYCFDYLNMNRVWLLVLETNKFAIKLYMKSGFKEEGHQRKAIYRNNRYIDYIMMSILKSEYKSIGDGEK